MDYNWIKNHCVSKKGVEADFKAEWEVTRFMIRGKMFAMQGNHKDGREIITIKVEPFFGEMLRQKYEDIIPGYYMNKQHWNSVYLDGCVPPEVIIDMLDKGYELLLDSLSKKIKQEIIEN